MAVTLERTFADQRPRWPAEPIDVDVTPNIDAVTPHADEQSNVLRCAGDAVKPSQFIVKRRKAPAIKEIVVFAQQYHRPWNLSNEEVGYVESFGKHAGRDLLGVLGHFVLDIAHVFRYPATGCRHREAVVKHCYVT